MPMLHEYSAKGAQSWLFLSGVEQEHCPTRGLTDPGAKSVMLSSY